MNLAGQSFHPADVFSSRPRSENCPTRPVLDTRRQQLTSIARVWACGGEQGDEGRRAIEWRAGTSFLLSLRGPLCRFVSPAAQSHQLHRSSTKAIRESDLGQIIVHIAAWTAIAESVGCPQTNDTRMFQNSLASQRVASVVPMAKY